MSSNQIYLCAISNIESGTCKEDCKFCTQSVKYKADIQRYRRKEIEEIVIEAKRARENKAVGFCLVTAGTGLDDKRLDYVCRAADAVHKAVPDISLIACNGIATYEQLKELKKHGIENYNHNLSLDEIASHIGISKSTALNLFHRFLHTTPVNYLIGYRLQAASWLLKNTNKKVKTIAYESGFHNVDYFCRLFKKRYHLTPSEYRCTCLKLLSADPSLQTHK